MSTINREALERPFPDNLVRSRQGPFGKTFSYVEGAEYIRRLNDAFEGAWSFEVIEHHIGDNEVFVLGKLIVGTVTKMAFGGSSITISRDGEIISVADDLKAATTDSLKKAASLFGVGLHLYGAETRTENSTAARPTNGGSNGRRNGNGNGNGQRANTGNGNDNRLTQRQLSTIWGMGRSLGQSADQLRQRAIDVYGVIPEQLSKHDASSLITQLGAALSGSTSHAS